MPYLVWSAKALSLVRQTIKGVSVDLRTYPPPPCPSYTLGQATVGVGRYFWETELSANRIAGKLALSTLRGRAGTPAELDQNLEFSWIPPWMMGAMGA